MVDVGLQEEMVSATLKELLARPLLGVGGTFVDLWVFDKYLRGLWQCSAVILGGIISPDPF